MIVRTSVIVIVIFLSSISRCFAFLGPKNNEKDIVTTLIEDTGYPVQVYNIWTEDKYRIRLHRIPYSRDVVKSRDRLNLLRFLNKKMFLSSFFGNTFSQKPRSVNKRSTKDPILLVHGLLCSGSMWIANASNSIAYQLSDAGNDVWLISARGTSPSIGHKVWNTNNPKYWDFSWHEIGVYDITRAIDFIVEKTQKSKLIYVGHSQGSTSYLVGMSQRPEYNAKISRAILLAPAAYMPHPTGLVGDLSTSDGGDNVMKFFIQTKTHYLPLRQTLLVDSIAAFCQDPFLNSICLQGVYYITGPGSEPGVDKYNMMLDLVKFVGDNCAVKQMVHYLQIIRNSRFQLFDYGPQKNQMYYSADKPPEYDLGLIDSPLTIFSFAKDALVVPEDIQVLLTKLTGSPPKHIITPGNHVDFLFDPSAVQKITNEILSSSGSEN
uniref:Lipase n=1 Tax=Culicoides sonorensis TaxID=179676 RepID=A0A336M471_CULSO